MSSFSYSRNDDGSGIITASPTLEEESRQFHSYRLEERHAPWKFFLPMIPEMPMLAIGLDRASLASIARSWRSIHVVGCTEDDLAWALEQGRGLGQEYRFYPMADLGALYTGYAAIAVNVKRFPLVNSDMILKLLIPGGCAAWIGIGWQMPSSTIYRRNDYAECRSYAFVPPHTRKLLIPLTGRKNTLAGLEFYKPGKRLNRIFLQICTLLARSNMQDLIGINQLFITRKAGHLPSGGYLLHALANFMNDSLKEATVYAGWRNLTFQLLDHLASFRGVAKVSDTEIGDRTIDHETNVLYSLMSHRVLRQYVPKIIASGKWQGHAVQIQAPLESKTYTDLFTPMHLQFLGELSKVNRTELKFEQWPRWSQIVHWAHTHRYSSLVEEKCTIEAVQHCTQRLTGRALSFHRTHGDFAPWHVLLANSGIKVVDWQDSEPVGLPLYDMMHYRLRSLATRTSSVDLNRLLADPLAYLRIEPQEINALCHMSGYMDVLRAAAIAYLEADQLGRRIVPS